MNVTKNNLIWTIPKMLFCLYWTLLASMWLCLI